MNIFFTFFSLVMVGYLTSYLAQRRGRDPYWWFAIGFMFGILALIILFILPKVEGRKALAAVDVKNEQTAAIAAGVVNEALTSDEVLNTVSSSYDGQWYYVNGNWEQQGPISYEELPKLYLDKTINQFTYVWTQGMGDWQRIEQLPVLYDNLRL